MLDKLKQAARMWQSGNTHGEILEVTGLTREQEFAVTALKATPEQVYAKIPRIKDGMKAEEIRTVLAN